MQSNNTILRFASHECVAITTPGCQAAADPSPNALCTSLGYQCGPVNNGSCAQVDCGQYGGGCNPTTQYCDLSSHQCEDIAVPSCQPIASCQAGGYQCGNPQNGTCSSTLDCNNPGCDPATSFCNGQYQCQQYAMSSTGVISSVWPSEAPIFFDSSDLPNSVNDISFSNDLFIYNDGSHYVRFNGTSFSSQCFQVALFAPEPAPSISSYVQLVNSPSISAGNSYQIWNSQQGCLNHPKN